MGKGEEIDFEMLNIIVNDALEGVDIASRYSAFYRKMLTHPQLRQAFLDALEMLDQENQVVREPLPELEVADLRFLQESAPRIDRTGPDGWRLSWHVSRARLQEQLFTSFSGVYRAADDFLENPIITLIRDHAEVDAQQIDLLLEAAQSDDADALELLLWLGADEPLPPLQATFQWGSYQASLVVAGKGPAAFPPLPLTAILDESGRQLTSDLTFSLEPATTA